MVFAWSRSFSLDLEVAYPSRRECGGGGINCIISSACTRYRLTQIDYHRRTPATIDMRHIWNRKQTNIDGANLFILVFQAE